MNILYVTANSLLRSTTSSLNAIIRELMPRGVKPVMLFRESGPWQETLAGEGIRCYIHPLFVPDKRAPFRSAAKILQLVRLLRRERIDLVHCNEHELYPALRIAARFAAVPVVTSLHWTLEPGFGHWAFAKPYEPAALQFLSRGQLALSKDGIPPEFPPQRVKLLMSGLFIDDFLSRGGDGRELRTQWGADARTVIIGTASAIKPRKRLEDFIDVIARLRSAGRPVVGVIAGGGVFEGKEYRRLLDARVASLHLEEHCRFVGNMDPVTPFFRAIDIAVNTSEMEILSMSMCEAMACETPTVAYAVGGNAETVHDPSFAVPFGAVEQLTAKVASLVDDAAAREAAGLAAARYVREHFDAPVLAARQAAIYEEVLRTPLRSAPVNAGRPVSERA